MEPHILIRLAALALLGAIVYSGGSCVKVNYIPVPAECTRAYPGAAWPKHCERYLP